MKNLQAFSLLGILMISLFIALAMIDAFFGYVAICCLICSFVATATDEI